MNRQRLLKQRAVRSGIFPIRSMTKPGAWDVADSCGPRGLELSKREATNFAASIARHKPKTRFYATDAAGQWHRANCEKVANPKLAKVRPCKCQRLVV